MFGGNLVGIEFGGEHWVIHRFFPIVMMLDILVGRVKDLYGCIVA